MTTSPLSSLLQQLKALKAFSPYCRTGFPILNDLCIILLQVPLLGKSRATCWRWLGESGKSSSWNFSGQAIALFSTTYGPKRLETLLDDRSTLLVIERIETGSTEPTLSQPSWCDPLERTTRSLRTPSWCWGSNSGVARTPSQPFSLQ